MTRRAAAVTALVALAACGNYSNTSVSQQLFLSGVPRHPDLQVWVPAPGTAAVSSAALAAACATRPAATWGWAKPTADALDGTLEHVLAFVDVVFEAEPTEVSSDARRWGPFDDAKRPDRQILVTLTRSHPSGQDGAPRFDYLFAARVKGTAAWTPVLTGVFVGSQATTGVGTLGLDFDALWALGMADADAPHGQLAVSYDRSGTPVRIGLELAQDGYGLPAFGYGYTFDPGTASGSLLYVIRQGGDEAVVAAAFGAAGEGRDAVTYTAAGGASASYAECWDAAACLTYVSDPLDVSCGAAPCSLGTAAACPALP